MKLTATVIFASANGLFKAPKGHDANGIKINGKHPQRRLQAINKFICRWVSDNIPTEYGSRVCDRFTNQIEHYNQSFQRPQCSYFDPSVKHGGPNPDQSMRGMRPAKNPKSRATHVPRRQRKRRSDSDEDLDFDDEDLMALDDCDGTETGVAAEFCAMDEGNDAVGRSVSVTQRKLKRYTTSMMKWCNRYIYECYGQRVHDHCVNRAKKIYTNLKNAIN